MGKLYQRDGRWAIDYRDARGRRVRKVVAGDKGIAQQILGDALGAVEKVRAGVLLADPREAKRPIQEHIDAYLADLGRRGRASRGDARPHRSSWSTPCGNGRPSHDLRRCPAGVAQ